MCNSRRLPFTAVSILQPPKKKHQPPLVAVHFAIKSFLPILRHPKEKYADGIAKIGSQQLKLFFMRALRWPLLF